MLIGEDKQLYTIALHAVKSFVECGHLCLRDKDCQYFQHRLKSRKWNCRLCKEISVKRGFHAYGTKNDWSTYQLLDIKSVSLTGKINNEINRSVLMFLKHE